MAEVHSEPTVTAGGTVTFDGGGSPAGGAYQPEVFSVRVADITSTGTTLSFQGVNPSMANWDLDNVSTVTASTAAPEPPAGPILAVAALSLFAPRRRGRDNAALVRRSESLSPGTFA